MAQSHGGMVPVPFQVLPSPLHSPPITPALTPAVPFQPPQLARFSSGAFLPPGGPPAPVHSASTRVGENAGNAVNGAAAALKDLRAQVIGLREELLTVRTTLDRELSKAEPPEEKAAEMQAGVDGLCEDLAAVGGEAHKLRCALGQVSRSRSAPCSSRGSFIPLPGRPPPPQDLLRSSLGSRASGSFVYRARSAEPPKGHSGPQVSTVLSIPRRPSVSGAPSSRRPSAGTLSLSSQERRVLAAELLSSDALHAHDQRNGLHVRRNSNEGSPLLEKPSPASTRSRDVVISQAGQQLLKKLRSPRRSGPMDSFDARGSRQRGSPIQSKRLDLAEEESEADKILRTAVVHHLREIALLRAENSRLVEKLSAASAEGRGSARNNEAPNPLASFSSSVSSPRLRAKSPPATMVAQSNVLYRLPSGIEPIRGPKEGRPALWHKPGRAIATAGDSHWSPTRKTGHWSTGTGSFVLPKYPPRGRETRLHPVLHVR